MDYSTGIVGGSKRRISLRSLQEIMFVNPRSGVLKKNTGIPHESKIRRAIKQLTEIGLIRAISRGKYLIFELPFATRDQSARKQADVFSTPYPDGEPDTNIHTKNTDKRRLVGI